MIADILTNVNLFVDGRGYMGKIEEVALPKLAVVLAEYSAGGISGGVDVPMGGHEKLESEFTLKAFDADIFANFSIKKAVVPIIMRGSLQNDEGAVVPAVATMRAIFKEIDTGNWKRGEEATIKVALSLRYYRLERDGVQLIEADPLNMVFKVNGVDQLADDRSALGI